MIVCALKCSRWYVDVRIQNNWRLDSIACVGVFVHAARKKITSKLITSALLDQMWSWNENGTNESSNAIFVWHAHLLKVNCFHIRKYHCRIHHHIPYVDNSLDTIEYDLRVLHDNFCQMLLQMRICLIKWKKKQLAN